MKWQWLRSPPPYLVWKCVSLKTNERCCEWGSHPLPGLCCGCHPASHARGWAPVGTVEQAGLAAGWNAGLLWQLRSWVVLGPGVLSCRWRRSDSQSCNAEGVRSRQRSAVRTSERLCSGTLFLIAPHHGPHRWTLWSHSTPRAPSGQDPSLLEVPGGRRFWAGLSAARSAPCRTVAVQQSLCPLLSTVEARTTCGEPGTALQADEPAEGKRRGRPEAR